MNASKNKSMIFNIFNILILIILALMCVLPFVNLFAKSVSAEHYVAAGKISFIPKGFNLSSYKFMLTFQSFKDSLKVSIIITLLGTLLDVFFTAFVGYAISRHHLKGRKVITLMYVFTMLFSGGMIPTFLVVKSFGLINSYFALTVPGLVAPFNLILVRNYFEGLPESIEESAKIDGARNLRIFFRIMLPLAIPSIATISIFYAVGFWNAYLSALIYMTSPKMMPLQVMLKDLIINVNTVSMDSSLFDNVAKESMIAAAIILVSLPIIVLYPFLQKYFVKGVAAGAVKQ